MAAQFGRRQAVVLCQQRCAQRGLRDQSPRRVAVQAMRLRAGREQLHPLEKIRRPAAGDAGHGVDERFVVHPQCLADRAQHRLGQRALFAADHAVGEQAGDAGIHQRRGVGHGAHDGEFRAGPSQNIGATDAGGDGNQQRPVALQLRGRGLHRRAQGLRFDRQHHDAGGGGGGGGGKFGSRGRLGDGVRVGDRRGSLDRGRVVVDAGYAAAAETLLQFFARRGRRLRHRQIAAAPAGVQQAADEAARHVAAADEGDAGR